MGETLMNIVAKIQKLPGEADDVRKYAENEFEALNAFSKAKAIAAAGFSIAALTKVPSVVVGIVEGFKNEMKELMETIEDIKKNHAKLIEDGKKCQAANKMRPDDAYLFIFEKIE